MTDTQWEWWQSAMAGVRKPTSDGHPEAGYYNWQRKPVKLWFEGEGAGRQLCATVDGRRQREDSDLRKITESWTWICKEPVSHEAYSERLLTGKWPGENTVVLGHNQAPPDDSLEAMIERLADLAREAENMIAGGEAKTEALWDQASDLANTLGEVEKKVCGLHKTEKEPHLEAGRRVDRKWFPLRDKACDLKERLKAIVITPFSRKRQAEAQKAAADAVAAGASPDQAPVLRTTAGQIKRGTALRTYYYAVIEDKAKLLESVKDHPDLAACIQKIADVAAAKKIALPGCKIIADQRAA